MQNAIISIIVPVYNVKEYLNECVESIVNQSYTALEIILVDDGSTDGSAEICDNWLKKDSRIRVIHKENGGLSDARNAGMSIATGEYIGFVDGDDKITHGMYSRLYDLMVSKQADMVCCSHSRFGLLNYTKECAGEICCYTQEEFLNVYMQYPRWFSPTAWSKLYKAENIKGIFFEKGVFYEDIMWTLKCALKCSKIVYANEALYQYRCRDGSIITTGVSCDGRIGEKEVTDHIYEFKKLENYWRGKGNSTYADNAAKEYLTIALNSYYMIKKNRQKELYSYLPDLKQIFHDNAELLKKWGKSSQSREIYIAGISAQMFFIHKRIKEISWECYVKIYHIYRKICKRG